MRFEHGLPRFNVSEFLGDIASDAPLPSASQDSAKCGNRTRGRFDGAAACVRHNYPLALAEASVLRVNTPLASARPTPVRDAGHSPRARSALIVPAMPYPIVAVIPQAWSGSLHRRQRGVTPRAPRLGKPLMWTQPVIWLTVVLLPGGSLLLLVLWLWRRRHSHVPSGLSVVRRQGAGKDPV